MNRKNIAAELLIQLKEVLFTYHNDSFHRKEKILIQLSKFNLHTKTVLEYHDCLLFIMAYPENEVLLKLAEKEIKRIAEFTKKLKTKGSSKLNDTGLPNTQMITRFSCDALMEMLHDFKCNIEIDSFETGGHDLNTLLNITLPNVLKQETTAGFDNLELLYHLGIKPQNRLKFLLAEFNKLNDNPLLKDYLWESLKIYLNIGHKSKLYSRSYNRINNLGVFYQNELLKKFDAFELINSKLPKPNLMDEQAKLALIHTIKKSMLLNMRETDTSTYMDVSSIEFYELERGVSIAIYGLTANRQLPYQSYIGYTAFKNGFPMAYGGSWVFGFTAMFGLNILEAFRGGESGYIMCQLLRTYLQRFKLNYIEVENYQFGKDNPDGIKSGAFWFYYRYGFRPTDKKLAKIAAIEYDKILKTKNYRTPEKILVNLCESNLALSFSNRIPIKKEEVFVKILDLIKYDYNGDNIAASQYALKEFDRKTNVKSIKTEESSNLKQEISLWAEAYKVEDKKRLGILMKMLQLKNNDAFNYNELVKKFFC